ncbi:DUF1418 family protein [Escherichia coli]
MRAIGKLPKGVLMLEFIGMMLLAVALLSVSDSLSLPEPFSRPEVQILMIFLGVLLHASPLRWWLFFRWRNVLPHS